MRAEGRHRVRGSASPTATGGIAVMVFTTAATIVATAATTTTWPGAWGIATVTPCSGGASRSIGTAVASAACPTCVLGTGAALVSIVAAIRVTSTTVADSACIGAAARASAPTGGAH